MKRVIIHTTDSIDDQWDVYNISREGDKYHVRQIPHGLGWMLLMPSERPSKPSTYIASAGEVREILDIDGDTRWLGSDRVCEKEYDRLYKR
jgi:hypothetical protein